MDKGTCFMCFGMSSWIVNILNTHLQNVFEKLTDLKIQNQSHFLCCICVRKLEQCYKFQQMATKPQKGVHSCKILNIYETHNTLITLSTSKMLEVIIPCEWEILAEKEMMNIKVEENQKVVKQHVEKRHLVYLQEQDNKIENKSSHYLTADSKNWKYSQDLVIGKNKKLQQSPKYTNIKMKSCNKGDILVEIDCVDSVTSETGTMSVDKKTMNIKQEEYDDVVNPNVEQHHLVCFQEQVDNIGNKSHYLTSDLEKKKYSQDVLIEKNKKSQQSPKFTNIKVENPDKGDIFVEINSIDSVTSGTSAMFMENMMNIKQEVIDHGHPNVEQDHLHYLQGQGDKIENNTSIIYNEYKLKQSPKLTNIKRESLPKGDILVEINCIESGTRENDSESTFNNHLTLPKDNSEKSNNNCSKMYMCDLCQKTFYIKQVLIAHIRTHTGDKPYRCNVCNKTFSQSAHLIAHKRTHTGVKPYKCNICNKTFSFSSGLKTHKRIHTDGKPYRCDICNKTFSQSPHLITHKRTHTGDKPYSCDLCNKTFSASSNLIKHKRTHTGDKPYSCDVCNKSFSVSSNLIAHKRTHIGDRPYSCDVCNKTFSQSNTLARHKRTHSSDKPYNCDMCDKAFSVSNNLIKHKRTHTGDKPYSCDMCNKAFSVSSNLVAHKRTHTGDRPYNCDVCNKTFSQSNTLTRHKRTHTNEKPYNCDVCDKAFSVRSNLITHKRTHTGDKPYNCDICDKAFSVSSNLITHKRKHTAVK